MSLTVQFGSRGPAFALRRVLLGTLFALGAVMPVVVCAQHGHQDRGIGIFMGDPEQVARRVDRLLDRVDATAAQRTQIRKIAQDAAADLKTLHEAGKPLHQRAMQLLTQAKLDANAIEALRQQMVQQLDQSSKRATKAMLDASGVLTPEQRTKLAEHMKRRHDEMKHRWHEQGQGEAP